MVPGSVHDPEFGQFGHPVLGEFLISLLGIRHLLIIEERYLGYSRYNSFIGENKRAPSGGIIQNF